MSSKLIVVSILTSLCLVFVAGSVQADLDLSNGYASGQWWNPERSGEGFYVEVIGEGENLQIAVAMYSYNEAGNQLWLVGNVPIAQGDTVVTVPLFLVEGPVWGTQYDPANRETTEFGSVVARFPTCDTALFNIQSNVQALESGNYSLVRLTEIVGMDCTDAPPEPEGGIPAGLWTVSPGLCFFVNPEGTHITESDSCNSSALVYQGGGVRFDPNGELNPIDCGVDVVCGGSWPIVDQRVSCVNDVGGVANIYFNSATEATVEVLESIETSGAVCLSAGSATPSQ